MATSSSGSSWCPGEGREGCEGCVQPSSRRCGRLLLTLHSLHCAGGRNTRLILLMLRQMEAQDRNHRLMHHRILLVSMAGTQLLVGHHQGRTAVTVPSRTTL